MTRPVPMTRAEFRQFTPMQTRLNDNDGYGHLYNVTYLELFDNAINGWLTAQGMQDLQGNRPIAVVAQNSCTYLRPAAYPDQLEIGLKLTRIGNASVTFALAMFRKGEGQAVAQAAITMVFVRAGSHDSTPIPPDYREKLAQLGDQP
ncbi:thioesterase family protein [Paracoccus sp. DMF-8]|uniref:acyl-CoA thioesterase n=1 Tax=Paracoccus sp. DMF-8 TaxID=3019445 RepID=UPI0023E78AF5|nr:thioesterase family protein [Paracoccus sp. DMF-8]MDF3605166.1 thioesterase family protein [Paracoccus sp. DMF-8]